MPPAAESLADRFRQTLLCYDEVLLRKVAQKLCRPRNQWPASELVERITTGLANPVMVDRRLKELPAACRQLLALIGHSRQPCWPVGSLIEMLVTLGHADGLEPVLELLDAGLLIPVLAGAEDEPRSASSRVGSFKQWLAYSHAPRHVIAAPLASQRATGGDCGLPECPGAVDAAAAPQAVVRESDGLEWPLRLAVLRQQVAGASLRRTQQGDFFKRDLERLLGDAMLNGTPDAPAGPPDPALFCVALALAADLLKEEHGELSPADDFTAWSVPLPNLLSELWGRLPFMKAWRPDIGWKPEAGDANPHASAGLLTLLLLGRLPADGWARADALDAWTVAHHPYWKGSTGVSTGIVEYLLGVAYLFRLVQSIPAADGAPLVRLSPTGRWILGLEAAPPPLSSFPQTLLVQPNLEILAYRQGLTPALIVAMGRFATWKSLGPACTLQLEPQSVYRGLEAGDTFTSMVQTLERHGMKTLPPAVLDSLRTWANKRERLTIYASAALFEFSTAAELTDALERGLPAQRLTDRLAVVASENEIDYRHFRLTGTRDYCLPPEPCVSVDADGVTLNIDLIRSDLLLEIEVQRFAEVVNAHGGPGRRIYRLTPASLAAAREKGVTPAFLGHWFEQRTGQPLSPAARLVLTGAETPPPELRRQIVMHVASAEIADGLQQWPGTRGLIHSRIGPTALVIEEEQVEALTRQMQTLGIGVVRTGQ